MKDYHPDCLCPARNIVATEQVASHGNKQPEPSEENEYRENVQEISIREASFKEHRNLLVLQMDLFTSTISSRLLYGFLIVEEPPASRYVTIVRA
jgi:hypothetical protein